MASLVSTVFKAGGVVFMAIVVIITVRTLTLEHRLVKNPPCNVKDEDFIPVEGQVLDNFKQAIRFKTISRGPGDYNTEELKKFQDFIVKAHPTIHKHPLVEWERVANYSLLYRIQGSDTSLKPYMLTGHLDVVPIAEPDKWEAPPFDGKVVDGYLYGRGTIDNKQTVMGILSALEFLLKRGHKPIRTFYVAFGHDEEVGGHDGARLIGQLLESRGVEIEFLLDEGLCLLDGYLPGISVPVALIGSSEKGAVTLRLHVNTTGGHSSMPGKESSIGILSAAVTRLEAQPHPSRFGTGPEKGTFEHLAPEMKLPFRIIMTNLWLFSPVVSRFLSMKPATNAVVRTTTAVTEFHAGIKSNVIAPWAHATVNHRIHPSETVKEVIEQDRKIIADDRVQIETMDSQEALPLSPYGDQDFGYQMIKSSIMQIWGHKKVVVAPGLMVGNTDTRHYTHLTKNIYRFSPTYMFPIDIPRFHGSNERMSIKNVEQAVNFFYHLMRNSDVAELEPLHDHGIEF